LQQLNTFVAFFGLEPESIDLNNAFFNLLDFAIFDFLAIYLFFKKLNFSYLEKGNHINVNNSFQDSLSFAVVLTVICIQ
jgi:hypothetical protein